MIGIETAEEEPKVVTEPKWQVRKPPEVKVVDIDFKYLARTGHTRKPQ